MGARISMNFSNGTDESVVLFDHWGGDGLKEIADKYMQELTTELAGKDKFISRPIDRLEPNTVMVDFIRYLTKDMPRVEDSLYLAKDTTEGDNSDYGHFTVDLTGSRQTWLNT
jgi:hypothetical protein